MREPKKVRTYSELVKSCRGLREHNETLKQRIAALEEEIICLTTATPLNERLLTQRRTILAQKAKLDAVERVIVDLDTQCTNAHATKMLRKALGGYVPEPPHRTLSNGKIKDTLTGEVGEPFSRRIDDD